jgi:tripartite-type tricarboxylate transporter receptor subunit TctC
MTTTFGRVSRRTLLGGTIAAGGACALGMPFSRRAVAQADYPSETFQVIVPTREGGGAERLARAFDGLWSELLGQPFEYEFFPGAAGQIGYEVFVNRREANGYNLLFGNMGPEMIMYATQNPDYKFPEDYFYFCRTDVDDSCVFVRADSEFTDIQQVVDAAKQDALNVAVSRIPHPASIGILALGEQTGGQFNLVPYQGGSPTQVAVLNGEADIGALPIAGTLQMGDQFRILTVFNKVNMFAEQTNNAPPVNEAFGTNIPDLYSSRSWAVRTEWADANPDDFQLLSDTAKQVVESDEFSAAFADTGAPPEVLQYGDREVCTEYALAMVELADRYREILSAEKG